MISGNKQFYQSSEKYFASNRVKPIGKRLDSVSNTSKGFQLVSRVFKSKKYHEERVKVFNLHSTHFNCTVISINVPSEQLS